MGTSAYIIYDLFIVFSSFGGMVTLIASLSYLMIYLIDITNIDKICD